MLITVMLMLIMLITEDNKDTHTHIVISLFWLSPKHAW